MASLSNKEVKTVNEMTTQTMPFVPQATALFVLFPDFVRATRKRGIGVLQIWIGTY